MAAHSHPNERRRLAVQLAVPDLLAALQGSQTGVEGAAPRLDRPRLAGARTTISNRRPLSRAGATVGVAAQVETLLRGADRAFLLSAPDPMAALYAPVEYRARTDGTPCGAWILGAKADVRVTRTSPASIAIEPVGTTMLSGGFDVVYRRPGAAVRPGRRSEGLRRSRARARRRARAALAHRASRRLARRTGRHARYLAKRRAAPLHATRPGRHDGGRLDAGTDRTVLNPVAAPAGRLIARRHPDICRPRTTRR